MASAKAVTSGSLSALRDESIALVELWSSGSSAEVVARWPLMGWSSVRVLIWFFL